MWRILHNRFIDCVNICFDARFDNIGRKAAAGNDFVAFQDFDHDLAQCVLTFGDRLNRIVFQRKILLYNPVNRLKGSVNRALTSGDMLFALTTKLSKV